MIEILAGALAGALAGMGMGGSALLIPVLTLLLGYDQLQAQATALISFIPAAIVAIIAHYRAKRIRWKVVGWMLPGGIAGVCLGIALTGWLDKAALRGIYAVFLTILGAYLILKAIYRKK